MVNTKSGDVRIFDFDLAQRVRGSGLSDFWGGTLNYFSPEICLKQQGYSLEKNAVWQLAVVWYAVSFERLPFGQNDMNAIVNSDAHRAIVRGSILARSSMSVFDLILMEQMLAKDPAKRPTLDEVVRDTK